VHFATAGCVALIRSLDFGSDDAFVVIQAKPSAALSLRVWLPPRGAVAWRGERESLWWCVYAERECGACQPCPNELVLASGISKKVRMALGQ